MIKVMLVDDELLSVKMLEKLINWSQYGIDIVAVAHDGLEAIDMVKEHQPSIIITDIKMPNLSGLEFIRKIREINTEVEFIIMSAYAEFSFIKDAMRLGCANYLLKPIDELELEKTLQMVVSKIRDKIISKKYQVKSELQKKKQLLRDYLKNSLNTFSAIDAFSQLNNKSESFTLMNVFFDSETISDYIGLSDIPGDRLNYIPERLEEIINKLCSCIVFDYDENAWVLVLFSNDISGIVKIAETIRDFFLLEPKLKAKLCFSRSYSSPDYLPIVYRQVKELMKYCLYIDNKSILGYGYNCNENEFNEARISALSREMTEALNRRNIAAATGIMDEIFKMSECISPSDLSRIYTLCFDALLTIKAIHISSSSQAVGHKKIIGITYQEMASISTINKLRNFMNEAILSISSIHRSDALCYTDLVENGIEYIRKNYNSNLSLEKICEHLAVSKNYFCSLFKRETGMSIWAYLTEIRMKKAKEFLENTDWKSYMIAYNVGYDNPSYFSRLFRRLYKQTPGEYREKYLTGRAEK